MQLPGDISLKRAVGLKKATLGSWTLASLRDIPGGIWALGFVSLLMDVSSEMIHALLPVYLVGAFGASMVTVGLVEGVAEATASITKIFSGALSDWLGKRKLLAALGYGLAALSKPLFPLAPSVSWLVGARFVDRVGKGIRGAPRDALVADISPEHVRGAAFGLRQALDTVGAFAGPLLAIALMWLTTDNFRAVFWIAVIPAILAFVLIVAAVHEPASTAPRPAAKIPLSPSGLKRLGATFWWIAAVAVVFTLARFSEAFLVLRAQSVGLSITIVPAVMVVMNVAYTVAAYPAGALSDQMSRSIPLGIGICILIAADLVLAYLPNVLGVGIGAALWGLHMAFTQGVLAALVADAAPADLRGTAYGVFNLVTGVAMLAASLIAGLLWDAVGPQGTFATGAVFAALSGLGLLACRGRLGKYSAAVER